MDTITVNLPQLTNPVIYPIIHAILAGFFLVLFRRDIARCVDLRSQKIDSEAAVVGVAFSVILMVANVIAFIVMSANMFLKALEGV